MALFKINPSNINNKIAKLMAICFNEPLTSVNFFLDNKSSESFCYTCLNQNDIISVLHSLPYKINFGKRIFKCSYLYGACTEPKYRKKGYMQKLIKFYEAQSKLNGFDFSFLVPDNEYLEKYYQKLGYKNFFKIKEVTLNKNSLLNICRLPRSEQNNHDKTSGENFYKNIEKLRLDIYNNISNILYSEKDIKYAADLYEFFGGKFISTTQGYGICVPINKNTLEIKDFTCKNEFIPDLLQKIYQNFPNFQNFKICTSTNDTFFKENTETQFFGMIKPLSHVGEKTLEEFIINKKHYAYLGLALD